MRELKQLRLKTKELSTRRDTLIAETEQMEKEINDDNHGKEKQIEEEMTLLEKLREEDFDKWTTTIEGFLGKGSATPKDKRTDRYGDRKCKQLEKQVAEKVVAGAEPKTPQTDAKRQRTEGANSVEE